MKFNLKNNPHRFIKQASQKAFRIAAIFLAVFFLHLHSVPADDAADPQQPGYDPDFVKNNYQKNPDPSKVFKPMQVHPGSSAEQGSEHSSWPAISSPPVREKEVKTPSPPYQMALKFLIVYDVVDSSVLRLSNGEEAALAPYACPNAQDESEKDQVAYLKKYVQGQEITGQFSGTDSQGRRLLTARLKDGTLINRAKCSSARKLDAAAAAKKNTFGQMKTGTGLSG